MRIDPEDILVCPACNGEFFMPIYHCARPSGSVDDWKQAAAYFCATCKQSFPTKEVKPRREAGDILLASGR